MRQVEADQKLLNTQPPVHEVDLERPLPQNTVAIFELLGRNDLYAIAFIPESVAEQLILALAGMVGGPELDDRNIGPLRSAELLIRLQQRRKQVLAAAGARQIVFLADLLHRRQVVEKTGQSIGIA